MPDTRIPFTAAPIEAPRLVVPAGERRSPCSGLPILSTEPLNQAERETLRQLARVLRLAADLTDEAIQRGRVEHGLEALQVVDAVQVEAIKVAAMLGKGR